MTKLPLSFVATALLLAACDDAPKTHADVTLDVTQTDVSDLGDDSVPDQLELTDLVPDTDDVVPDAAEELPYVVLTADDYCEATVDLFCDFYLRCGRMAVTDLAECKTAFVEACNNVYEPIYRSLQASGDLAFDQTALSACGAHLATVECRKQSFDLDGPCAALWIGQRPAGQPCGLGIESFVCHPDSTCVISMATFCGECVAVAPVGQSCAGAEVTCSATAQCLDGVCVERALPGEPCGAEQPCSVGIACTGGVCGERVVVGLGDSCDQTLRCPYKSVCLGGVCVATGLLGEACAHTYECASGWCEGDVCALFLGAGEVCTLDESCQSGRCSGGVCEGLASACL